MLRAIAIQILFIPLIAFFLSISLFDNARITFAQDTGMPSDTGSVTSDSGSVTSDRGSVTSPGASQRLKNPLQSTSIEQFLIAIVDVVLTFLTPIIVLFIMYAGYLYVTARGEEGQITKAKNALLYAIIGGVIIVGARLIISVIEGTVRSF